MSKTMMRGTGAQLKEKIVTKEAVVSVIGMGYVGLPLAVEKAKVGFRVVGVDKNRERVKSINAQVNYIDDVDDAELRQLVADGMLTASDNFDSLSSSDVIIICVPTPLSENKDPDISHIVDVTREIGSRLRPGQLVTLESSTYPGTTEDVMLPILQQSGLTVGEDFFLAFSPERVDPGNKRYTTKNTSKVVGGITPACLDVAQTFYLQTILKVVAVSSTAVAELTKVFENTYRAVNIALVNELMMLCDRMKIDIWEVIDAAGTKPFGIQTFYPGPGVGGHCIPIDPFYLTWKARQYDFHTRFIELASEVNTAASYYVSNKVTRTLNERERCLKNAKITVLGVTYKKDVDDMRESPALKVIDLLLKGGAQVVYHDPFVRRIKAHAPYDWELDGRDLSEELIANADCVLILTDHTCFNYKWIVEKARLVVDARNATKKVTLGRERIVTI